MIQAVLEYNDNGCLLYAEHYPGAFARGKTPEEAIRKLPVDVEQYCRWSGLIPEREVQVVQRSQTALQVCDADSEVLFESEKMLLSTIEYEKLKCLALRSAKDFQVLYDSIPDKDRSGLPVRKTFYGEVPRTARQMYEHTNGVTNYYSGQLGVKMENPSSIMEGREEAFHRIERLPGFLEAPPIMGDYEEFWSLRKVLRRFIWHDRIHARAMYRMAVSLWEKDTLANPFFF